MKYVISATEKTRKKGAETETKALLYLLKQNDKKIHYFFYRRI